MPIISTLDYVSGGGEEIRTLAGAAPIKKRGRRPFCAVPGGNEESIVVFSLSLGADIATDEGEDTDGGPKGRDDADDAEDGASGSGLEDAVD